jgi:Transcriptional regulator PadR-like family
LAAEPKVEVRPRRWLIPVALVLLQEENSYGYELMERIEEEFGFEQINAGSVYRALRQMDGGLGQSVREVPPTHGPVRPGIRKKEVTALFIEWQGRSCPLKRLS